MSLTRNHIINAINSAIEWFETADMTSNYIIFLCIVITSFVITTIASLIGFTFMWLFNVYGSDIGYTIQWLVYTNLTLFLTPYFLIFTLRLLILIVLAVA